MRAHRLVGIALAVVLVAGVGALLLERQGGMVAHEPSVLAAWTSGGLPDGFGAAVSALDTVESASVVRGGIVDLVASWDAAGNLVDQPPAGMAIPLDALAVDPQTHPAVLGSGAGEVFRALEPGQALLGESSARLRGLGEGASLELAPGQRVTVTRVVPDDLVGHAEIVLPAPTALVARERFVRLIHSGDRHDLEEAIRRAAPGHAVTMRGLEEQAQLRPGGSLLPQVAVKERFGEFAYRPGTGRGIVQDDAWIDANIRVAQVPILGQVACHRDIVPLLDGAMSELRDAGLARLVDPSDYAGCYGPRLIRPGQALSRHAWGIAVDLNATTNRPGDPPTQDPRLVETMARWGFTWGGAWLVPDGMHFEYQAQPAG